MKPLDYTHFTDALATSRVDFTEAFQALDHLSRQIVGHKLFTLMTVDRETKTAARIYSNMPNEYPVFGKKPANISSWSETVIERHQTFVANDIETISEVFDDYELIRSLGCESVINVPIIIAGQVIGTINCLAKKDHYTSDRVAASQALKLPGAACFLSQLSSSNNGGM